MVKNSTSLASAMAYHHIYPSIYDPGFVHVFLKKKINKFDRNYLKNNKKEIFLQNVR